MRKPSIPERLAALRALRASLAEHMPAGAVDQYASCPPRASEDFPRWLHERAAFRQMASLVARGNPPTEDEREGLGDVIPITRPRRPPGGVSPAS